MVFLEQAILFPCAGESLLGIVAVPEKSASTGILVVVGGPQYRVGSHRQFLLLSRALASAGYPAMRFDYRGMGDSAGTLRNFESVNEDIGAAIDAFRTHCPLVERIVLWGLCDAASACLLYWDATRDVRVTGLVLLNPWVRSTTTLARTHIRHYYGQRLLQADFWRKLATGNLGLGGALKGFVDSLLQSRQENILAIRNPEQSFQKKMTRAIAAFPGRVLLILSGNDFTAKEFQESIKQDQALGAALDRDVISTYEAVEADHTFSSVEWRRQIEGWTLQWIAEDA